MTTLEVHAIDRPIENRNYDVWKSRMKTFMLVMDFDVLYVCEHDVSKLELNNEQLTMPKP